MATKHFETQDSMLKFRHSHATPSAEPKRAKMSVLDLINKEMLIGAGTAAGAGSLGVFAFFRAWSSFRTNNATDSSQRDMIDRLEGEIKRKDTAILERETLLSQKDQTINTLWREKSLLEGKLVTIEANVEFLKEQNAILVQQLQELRMEVKGMRR